MPFQSEKQRRYLWANEPEIARDWTDTYGSRVRKFDGGEIYRGIEQLLGPRNSPLPGGRELSYQFRDPQAYYMENRPDYDLYDYGHRGPIASTGLQDEGEGYIKYKENYLNPYSWEARFEDEHAPYKIDSWERNPMLQRALIAQKQRKLYGEEEPSGINQLPNDFNRDYRPEDANWRTRLRNKGSGIKRALASGLGKIVDFPLGIMSAIAQGFPNNAQEQAMVDLYGGNTVTEGPMAGYHAASMFGKGLPAATQKRISKREETLQKMADWEGWRKKRFQQKTGILKAELAKQQEALQAQANKIPTTYHPQPQDPGGRSVANFSRTSPGGISQATSRAARTDQSGNQMSGWKW